MFSDLVTGEGTQHSPGYRFNSRIDIRLRTATRAAPILLVATLTACSDSGPQEQGTNPGLEQQLIETMDAASNGNGADFYKLPDSDDLASIPQDPANPLTREKIALGQMVFHDTGFALNGVSGDELQSWSCATCHHAKAGFKSGILQGVGEGGAGFGSDGSKRFLMTGFDASAEEGASNKPDVQPLTSPAALNAAWQEVMLWNGQFGNAGNGVVNKDLPADIVTPATTPIANNARQLAGLEIQAIAGAGVHRLELETDSPLQTVAAYQQLWNNAYPDGSDDVLEDVGKAIAAFERSIIAHEAPFQRWLRNDGTLTEAQLRGGVLFFGKAGCAGCHTGPALSSPAGATEADMFASIGLNDFDPADPAVSGTVDERSSFGRGGFTGKQSTRFQFKIPQLYNLADTDVFGHGGSIRSIREMVVYKNQAQAQKPETVDYLDSRFTPLGLSDAEVDDLTEFLTTALHDPNLMRYQPGSVPSDKCVVVDPLITGDDAFTTLCNGKPNQP